MHRTRASAAAGLAGLVVLAACATAGQQPAEPRVESVPVLLASADLRLPVQDYLATAEQNELFARARLKLVQDCMKRFGVDYPAEPVTADQYGPRSLTDRRYGITDAELARTSGYGLGARDPGLQKRPPRPDIDAAGETVLTGAGQSVVNGDPVPAGGCLGEADRTLSASVPTGTDVELGRRLQLQSFDAAKQDSRVRAVFRAWSDCMAQHGYHYADPLAAAGDPTFTGVPTAAQIAVATTDIACKSATNLVGVWFTVETAYQKRQIEQDPAGFAAVRQALAARADTSQKTVAMK
ncbi:MAG: hypothetical protein ABW215_04805, partial [Kibdelosporangium sp.]